MQKNIQDLIINLVTIITMISINTITIISTNIILSTLVVIANPLNLYWPFLISYVVVGRRWWLSLLDVEHPNYHLLVMNSRRRRYCCCHYRYCKNATKTIMTTMIVCIICMHQKMTSITMTTTRTTYECRYEYEKFTIMIM